MWKSELLPSGCPPSEKRGPRDLQEAVAGSNSNASSASGTSCFQFGGLGALAVWGFGFRMAFSLGSLGACQGNWKRDETKRRWPEFGARNELLQVLSDKQGPCNFETSNTASWRLRSADQCKAKVQNIGDFGFQA